MMRSKTKLLAPAALTLVALSIATACGGATAGSKKAGAAGKTVCYVSAVESHPYVSLANEAIKAEAKAAKVKLRFLSQEFDAQKGTEQLSSCVSQHVDAIILWPLDAKAYIPQMTLAKKANIPIVMIDTPMSDAAKPYYASFTGPDTYAEGEQAATMMNDALPQGGNVVIVAGQAGNPTTTGRTQGFLDGLKKAGSSIKVTQTVNADFDQQKALVASRDLITRHGSDIDGVYAEDDTMALGWKQALAESSIKKNIQLVGINGQKEAFKLIEDGEMFGTVLESPTESGKLTMRTVIQILDGKKVNQRIPLQNTVITKANIAEHQPAF